MKPLEAESRSQINVNLSCKVQYITVHVQTDADLFQLADMEVQMFACGRPYMPKLAAQPTVPKSMARGFFTSECHLLPYEMFWGVRDIKDFWEVQPYLKQKLDIVKMASIFRN